MQRKLKNNNFVNQLDDPIALVIYTKCPEKWQIKDLETGQVYIGSLNNFIDYKNLFIKKINDIKFGGWKKYD